jgi:hypothetical protein
MEPPSLLFLEGPEEKLVFELEYLPVQKFLVNMGRMRMACPTTMATKSSRHDQMAAVGPFLALKCFSMAHGWNQGHLRTTSTMVTRRMAAIITKIPAPKRPSSPILRHNVVLTGMTTGAGIAIMHKSVTIFIIKGGTMLRND